MHEEETSTANSVHIKCPRMEAFLEVKTCKQAKDTDANLTRIQVQMLDAVNPLVNLLELACKRILTPRDATESAQQVLRLLENALGTISMDCRQEATRFQSKELCTLAQKEDTFRDAAPCSLVKTLTNNQNSILIQLVLWRDFLPWGKISLFRWAAPNVSERRQQQELQTGKAS